MPTEWLTPHINTLSNGSLERNTLTLWLITLKFFFFFVFAWLDILKISLTINRDLFLHLNHAVREFLILRLFDASGCVRVSILVLQFGTSRDAKRNVKEVSYRKSPECGNTILDKDFRVQKKESHWSPLKCLKIHAPKCLDCGCLPFDQNRGRNRYNVERCTGFCLYFLHFIYVKPVRSPSTQRTPARSSFRLLA